MGSPKAPVIAAQTRSSNSRDYLWHEGRVVVRGVPVVDVELRVRRGDDERGGPADMPEKSSPCTTQNDFRSRMVSASAAGPGQEISWASRTASCSEGIVSAPRAIAGIEE